MAGHVEMEQLNERFALREGARFVAGVNDLPKLEVRTDLAEADLYLHGCHVTHYQPRGDQPLLYLSPISRFEDGRAIRGGIPICYPWFGDHPDDAHLPAHGFVRRSTWQPVQIDQRSDGSIRATFAFDHEPNDQFPSPFRLICTVDVGRSLAMSFDVHNGADEPLTCELALHTYLAVEDVRRVQLLGLERVDYLDKTEGFRRRTQPDAPVTFTAETDRIYLNTPAEHRLVDIPAGRHLLIRKTGARSTVVWSPWVDKTRDLDDLPAGDWPRVLCVETGNVGPDAMHIPPHQSHTLRTTLSAERSHPRL